MGAILRREGTPARRVIGALEHALRVLKAQQPENEKHDRILLLSVEELAKRNGWRSVATAAGIGHAKSTKGGRRSAAAEFVGADAVGARINLRRLIGKAMQQDRATVASGGEDSWNGRN